MTVAVEKKSSENKVSASLTKLDRCDRCSARAYMRVYKKIKRKNGELIFCMHHYREYEPVLITDNWIIDDQSHVLDEEMRLYSKPSDDNF